MDEPMFSGWKGGRTRGTLPLKVGGSARQTGGASFGTLAQKRRADARWPPPPQGRGVAEVATGRRL